jgi:hypothetical protein
MIEIENISIKPEYEYWYIKDTQIHHRMDGPAIVRNDGSNLHAWFFHGVYIGCKTQEEFERTVKTEEEYELHMSKSGSSNKTPAPEYFYDKNNNLHRMDGPAIETRSYNEWYFHGIRIVCNTQEQFSRTVKTEEEYDKYNLAIKLKGSI